ncbi:hypothetical protein FXW07_12505 [Methanosarcina sp. DH1]|uniref:hypothetical protein n=1 Tax=Methanosarcina sp. DH1 TaxID=2605695 RepID=UPI001E41A1E7|nr:hypothetical protein [Methanosarcina sp. DH1]MCC4767415.1 hypothetical protein [Methanosarcina sp. DH1]
MENRWRYLYTNEKQTQISIQDWKEKQVGIYLRNQNMKDETFDYQYKKRAECEKIHGHIKGTVKFDIRKVRNQSRKQNSTLY